MIFINKCGISLIIYGIRLGCHPEYALLVIGKGFKDMMETRRRTVVKAVLWAALGWVTMGLVGLAFTGSLAAGGTMASVNTVVGLVCYVIYERIWAAVQWGRWG